MACKCISEKYWMACSALLAWSSRASEKKIPIGNIFQFGWVELSSWGKLLVYTGITGALRGRLC